METAVLKLLFIVSVTAQFGKHVYVQLEYEWLNAQNYCRAHHTDLSPITTQHDEERLKIETYKSVSGEFWIGLYEDETHWNWSGGGRATYIPWAEDQPESIEDQIYVGVCWHNCTRWTGWHNVPFSLQLPFFCFNLIVMEEKRTWDKAIKDCRQEHTSLTSLASETEHLLAVSQIQHDHITERVWIGLRYLVDSWLWVDGEPLMYKGWAQGGDQDHQCPIWKRCGALTKEGAWENWDCQDKLNFICY